MHTITVDQAKITWVHDPAIRKHVITLVKGQEQFVVRRKTFWGYSTFACTLGGEQWRCFVGQMAKNHYIEKSGQMISQKLNPLAWLFLKATLKNPLATIFTPLVPLLLFAFVYGAGFLAWLIMDQFRGASLTNATSTRLQAFFYTFQDPLVIALFCLAIILIAVFTWLDIRQLRQHYHGTGPTNPL